MSKYFIYEGNIEKLEKKLSAIEHKCSKYNVHFHYEKLGEVFREVEYDGRKFTTKFIEIEVDGFMRHENWEFIATIDHTKNGNIIRQFNTTIEVPNRYRCTDPFCEHCKTHRRRKFTYLVHNIETDEWKQVGASCLKEFTRGLDAEYVAKYESFFKFLDEGSYECYKGVSYDPLYNLEDFLCYAKETVDKFGYVSSSCEDYDKVSTKTEAWNFYCAFELGKDFLGNTIERAENIGFNALTDKNKQYVKEAIKWIQFNTDKDGYIQNLRIACSEEYFSLRNIGFIVSLIPTYYRYLKNLEYEANRRKKGETEIGSKYQGNKGDRITFIPKSSECVYSNDGFYGRMYFYKFVDESENVYMWSTGKSLDLEKISKVTGTVKNHEEFRGVKQTHLTRCKVELNETNDAISA